MTLDQKTSVIRIVEPNSHFPCKISIVEEGIDLKILWILIYQYGRTPFCLKMKSSESSVSSGGKKVIVNVSMYVISFTLFSAKKNSPKTFVRSSHLTTDSNMKFLPIEASTLASIYGHDRQSVGS